jgi:hypothetical protein
MDDKLFYANVERWALVQPKAARLLPYVDTSAFEFARTAKGELNLIKKGEDQPYHDVNGAAEEARCWFETLDLKGVHLLYVYGVGLGYYYEAAKGWLKKKKGRSVVFLEDDPGVICKLFETELGSALLKDCQVQLLFFKQAEDQEEALENIYWNFVLTRQIVSALGCYGTLKKEGYDKLSRKIAYDAAVKNALVHEYLRFGGAFFINYYQNMLKLPGSVLGNRFFKQYEGVPAIICGAGPSLEKNATVLKGLQDKALIFAGGSAMNVLNAAGFQPHFGAGIDPNPAQLERLSTNQAYEVPYFYRNRMFHEAFMTIRGPRLYVTGSGGYDIAEYFEEKLGIEGEPIEEGHNVVNFCLEVAYAMGCNPIIFAGMDLAFTGLKAYAPGVVEDVSMDSNRVIDDDEDDSKTLLWKDVGGEPIYTLWKWVAEADWIGNFAKEHRDVTIVNATEGGIGFPGVPNITLEKAAKSYLGRSYDLFNRVHADIQNSVMPWVTLEKVEAAMTELRHSLSRCVEHLDVLVAENKKIIDKVQLEKELVEHTQTGIAALAETELADEPGYKYVCDIFNAVYMRMLSRKLHDLRPTGRKSTEWKRQIKRILLNNKRLGFLRNVAQVNAELIDYAFKQRDIPVQRKAANVDRSRARTKRQRAV